jgi:hypothetical protein
MVNSCTQEQAFPIAERKTPDFECLERQLYGMLGSQAPSLAVKLQQYRSP